MLTAIAMFILINGLPAYMARRMARRKGRSEMFWFIAGIFGSWFVVGILALMRSSSTPTLAEYLAANPTCKTPTGIACKFCGSRSIRLWRDESGYAIHQRHFCNHCGELLYRSG
ncbi:hypothetical protein [Cupriavidus basilensis]|uniref:hypothetical protein n=1 Tax=Cupriavidus basilensis TaxID=68895 RepID=UPI000B26B367|nr:hypothetical protein [Cupriavidus basilensis]